MDGLVTQPGQELDGIVLRLARPGTLRGQVVIPGGKPALAPRTRVAVQADWPGLQRCMWVPEATVDAEGRFELDFVPPGKSELRVVYWIPADNALAPKSVTPPAITLAEGETMTSVTLTVVAGAE